jgi:hypothetical protein
VAAPGDERGARGIVVGEIVLRHMGVDALVHVAEVLVFQGVGVVLGVARDENLPPALGRGGVEPRLTGILAI